MKNLARYNKAVVAVAGALILTFWGTEAQDAFVAFLTAVGVYGVRNG